MNKIAIFRNTFSGIFTKTLFTMGLIGIAFSASAQSSERSGRYQAPALWEATGKVKTISYDKETALHGKKINFTDDGRLKNQPMSYDAEMRPIGFGSNFGSVYNYMNVAYDDASHPMRIRIQKGNGDKEEILDTAFHYEGGIPTSALTVMTDGNGETTFQWTFSDYRYDSAGNWVSRKVQRVELAPGTDTHNPVSDSSVKTSSTEEYTETRKIEYYK